MGLPPIHVTDKREEIDFTGLYGKAPEPTYIYVILFNAWEVRGLRREKIKGPPCSTYCENRTRRAKFPNVLNSAIGAQESEAKF